MDDAERREKARLYAIRYRASDHGKAAIARYEASDKGRANRWRKNHSPASQEAHARYHASERSQKRKRAKRETGETAAYAVRYRQQVRLLHPERLKARAAVNWAVRSGYLTRPPQCEACRKEAKTEAHHMFGYEPAEWFTVQWFCRPCHRRRHPKELD